MYGTQAIGKPRVPTAWFENDVKMYGTQAEILDGCYFYSFENDVKMYGTQAVYIFEYNSKQV